MQKWWFLHSERLQASAVHNDYCIMKREFRGQSMEPAPMANENQVALPRQGASEWNAWRKEADLVIDVSGADLSTCQIARNHSYSIT
jgi:hypothetical protein